MAAQRPAPRAPANLFRRVSEEAQDVGVMGHVTARSHTDRQYASSAVAGDDGGSDVFSESCHVTSL